MNNFSLSKDQKSALMTVYGLINEWNIKNPNEKIPWILSGSTSLVLQGVKIIPHDIDILTDKTWAKQLDLLLSDYCIKKSEFSGTEKYRSYFGVYMIQWIKVEVMGEMQYRQQDNTRSPVNQTHPTFFCVFQENEFPILSLEHELREYIAMWRMDTAQKIKEKLAICDWK